MGFEFSSTPSSDRVDVGPLVFLTFLDESLVDALVQVWVETSMMDLLLIVVFEFVFDGKAMRFLLAGVSVTLEFIYGTAAKAGDVSHR